jgi:hypothetical protein
MHIYIHTYTHKVLGMRRYVSEFHTADFAVEIRIPAHHFQMPDVIQLYL